MSNEIDAVVSQVVAPLVFIPLELHELV